VRDRAEAIGARRYVQSHLIDTPRNESLCLPRGTLDPVPGIAEVWWNSLEDFRAAVTSPRGAAALAELAEDETTFIDIARSQLFLTNENFIFDFTGGQKVGRDAVKCIYLLARRADLTTEARHRI
jgi:hypothetical protein